MKTLKDFISESFKDDYKEVIEAVRDLSDTDKGEPGLISIEDFELKLNGQTITHVVADEKDKLHYWSGSPEEDIDKDAAEIFPKDENEEKDFLKELVSCI